MGQQESKLPDRAVDMSIVDNVRADLLQVVELNHRIFHDLSENSVKIIDQLLPMKQTISSKLKPFFDEADYSIGLEGHNQGDKADVSWVELDAVTHKGNFSPRALPADFSFRMSKKLLENNTNQYSEELSVAGLPTPEKIKDQIHQCLNLFCKLDPVENSPNLYSWEIPPENEFMAAFTEVFPMLSSFCSEFVHLDQVHFSKEFPQGVQKTVEGNNHYNEIHATLPVNKKAFKKAYPQLWTSFTSMSKLEMRIQDKKLAKTLITYTVTTSMITVSCVISGRHMVWHDKESKQPLLDDQGDLDRFLLELEECFDLKVVINPVLQLFAWGGAVTFPEVHLLVKYRPKMQHGKVLPRMKITCSHVESFLGEWLLSYVLPIAEWRENFLKSFESNIRSSRNKHQPECSGFLFDWKAVVPKPSPAMKALLYIYATETLIEEGLRVGHKAASAVHRDYLTTPSRLAA